MAFIRAACILAVALVAALFAVENMHEVAVGFFPIGATISLPVYLVVLVPLAVGLVAGRASSGMAGGGARRRRLRRRAAPAAGGRETVAARTGGKDPALPAAP